MTNEELRERAKAWLNQIRKDATQLAVHNHIFWELQEIVESNPEFQNKPGRFLFWIGINYQVFAAAAIRRTIDGHKDVMSLLGLLKELKKHPFIITREYFLTLYTEGNDSAPKSRMPKENADRVFNEEVGVKRNELDPDQISLEIQELETQAKGIEHFMDRLIAHRSKIGLAKPAPKLQEIEQCLEIIERLIRRYELLLTGSSGGQLLPTIIDDWTEIFSFPWIQPQKFDES